MVWFSCTDIPGSRVYRRHNGFSTDTVLLKVVRDLLCADVQEGSLSLAEGIQIFSIVVAGMGCIEITCTSGLMYI